MTRKTRILMAVMGIFLAATHGAAFEPNLPAGARETAERSTELDIFDAPVGAFDGAHVPSVALEGKITRRSWRISIAGLTPLQVIAPLRRQLEELGYELVFECAARNCGGFDFRFATEVLPGPNMYVNISRYYYVTALSGERSDPSQAIGILASVTEGSAYVQVITADKNRDVGKAVPVQATRPVAGSQAAAGSGDLGATLVAEGRVVLGDLNFATGTSDLGPGPFTSLENLAQQLSLDPKVRVALVGHTDTVGGLDANTAISRARAQSVKDRLTGQYGVAPERLEAEGVAYLAPVVSNLTEEGRARNRRVEAVLLSLN